MEIRIRGSSAKPFQPPSAKPQLLRTVTLAALATQPPPTLTFATIKCLSPTLNIPDRDPRHPTHTHCVNARCIAGIASGTRPPSPTPIPAMGVCASCLGLNRSSQSEVSISPLIIPANSPSLASLPLPLSPTLSSHSDSLTHPQPSDTSHLLGDPYQAHYGGVNAGASQGSQLDQEEIRRQRDALERLCAQTSDKLIDVSQKTHSDEASRRAQLARLFTESFPPVTAKPQTPSLPESEHSSSDTADLPVDEVTWLSHLPVSPHSDLPSKETSEWDEIVPPSGPLCILFGA
ncbi:hypothetical protein K402DRAFT_405707 [Aulographum hederae CBS 113979]|uniref:Uncharacterized protein n=1 Tax=Aulographum hederae CBS 113979 TaxID=1176131 RepID=A0A6G1GVU7_9PEZI|nr:hypothetical protein K402DRAFT_405707 [Aulographum hederae CBS 113979]